MATYGSFPGVKVTTQTGGVTGVQIGEEEKVVIFGEANYDGSNDVDGTASASSPEQINARVEADQKFGADSELADAMREALADGANINFLYGVAVPREDVSGESQSSQTGSLDNTELVEDTSTITFDDGGQNLSVEFRYKPSGSLSTPTSTDTVFINPITGAYAADSAPGTSFSVDYTYNDYNTAFTNSSVRGVVNENETGIYVGLFESDAVSNSLQSEVSSLRDDYQMVNAFNTAEPNDNELLSSGTRGGADARYDTSGYSTGSNSSDNNTVEQEYYFKFAPGRLLDVQKTIGGGIAGKYAGNSLNDPVYNEELEAYSDNNLEQAFTKTEADNMRNEDIIPVRDAGTIRIRGNRSTYFSESDAVAADFWTRRITDRVILIGKQVGDQIIGRINDDDTRSAAKRAIEAEMRDLVRRRLIRSNADGNNWSVDVFEDSNNDDQVNINIAFSPYGIVKQVDETITVNTN